MAYACSTIFPRRNSWHESKEVLMKRRQNNFFSPRSRLSIIHTVNLRKTRLIKNERCDSDQYSIKQLLYGKLVSWSLFREQGVLCSRTLSASRPQMREVPGSTRNMRGASALCHVTMSQHYGKGPN